MELPFEAVSHEITLTQGNKERTIKLTWLTLMDGAWWAPAAPAELYIIQVQDEKGQPVLPEAKGG